MKQTTKIIVYGSLMQGFHNYNKYLKPYMINVEQGCFKGQLFHLSQQGYPGALQGNGKVFGEIITLSKSSSQVLTILDELEEYFGAGDIFNEYDRWEVEVLNTESGSAERLPVYFYNLKKAGSPANLIYIPSGDWRQYLSQTDTQPNN